MVRLASHGADVVVNYHSSPKAAEAVAEECRSLGVRAICVQANISKPEPIAHLFKAAIDEFGAIDIVMSNSGVEHFDDIPNVKTEDIDKVFGINVKGQFLVAQQAFAHVRENGRVILMSSISAVWVTIDHSHDIWASQSLTLFTGRAPSRHLRCVEGRHPRHGQMSGS